MSAYRKDFHETKYIYIYFNKNKRNFKKNIVKFGKKLKIVSKKNLIVNQYKMKNM